MMANGVENSSSDNGGKQLLDKKKQQYAANGGQVEVMNLEKSIELERLTTTHDLAATKDDDVVGDQHGGSGAERRHGSLARDELEILRLVALDGLEDLFEDGPELKTEWTVECRHAIANPA